MPWDTIWEEIHRNHAWGRYPPEELVRFVSRAATGAEDRRALRFLEVGCGAGANLWFLAREGFSVHGIDGAPAAVAAARARLDRECPGWSGNVLVGEIADLPFPDRFFDAAIDVEAIYANSYEDAKAIYAEMARVCKRGGHLFAKTFAAGCVGEGTGVQTGPGAWRVSEGPLAGLGSSRFTAIDQVSELIHPFLVDSIEVVTRTIENRRHELRELVIEGICP
jgi:SAM-dependent methyltransferase